MRRAAVLALVLSVSAAPQAVAGDSGISSIVSGIAQAYGAVATWGIIAQIQTASKQIAAEYQKASVVTMNAIEAAANYKVQEETRGQVAATQEALQQPSNLCQNIAIAGAVEKADVAARQYAIERTRSDLKSIAHNDSANKRISEAHTRSQQFCSQEDVARGRCPSAASAQLAGADLQASYLYGSPDGTSDAYIKGQSEAVDSFISRIVSLAPPEALPQAHMERTVQGLAYVETQRRYAAINSLAAHSLRSIAATHTPR